MGEDPPPYATAADEDTLEDLQVVAEILAEDLDIHGKEDVEGGGGGGAGDKEDAATAEADKRAASAVVEGKEGREGWSWLKWRGRGSAVRRAPVDPDSTGGSRDRSGTQTPTSLYSSLSAAAEAGSVRERNRL